MKSGIKSRVLIFLTVLSVLMVIAWLITDYFGGMILWLLIYYWIIIPFLILYLITGIIALVRILVSGIKANKMIFYAHLVGLTVIAFFILKDSEILKSPIVFQAMLKDDLSTISIKLRENGKFETKTFGVFGSVEKISGMYKLKNDTLIFMDKPYSNDFIPDSMLIHQEDKAVFFEKDKNGQFVLEKSFANYFEIIKDERNK